MGRAPGGRRATRAEPSQVEVASDLKVGTSTTPNKLAGAICNVVREAGGGPLPGVMATGPAAINQAIKGIAIARKYLLEEDTDLLINPRFEGDLRDNTNIVFELKRCNPIDREPSEDDLSSKDKTDCYKLAGAIAGRLRDREEVAVTTKGSIPVLVAVKAIAIAQDYVQENNLGIKFAVQFRDLEDPEMGNRPSTYLHFAMIPHKL